MNRGSVAGSGELMLRALDQSRKNLDDQARKDIIDFVKSQIFPTGGFVDRTGKPDPYYSVFGYSLALVFDIDITLTRHQDYLQSLLSKGELDFVHAICVIRCFLILDAIEEKRRWGDAHGFLENSRFLLDLLSNRLTRRVRERAADCFRLIETYRARQEGYHHFRRNADYGTVYAAYLLKTLFADLGGDQALEASLTNSVKKLQAPDGSFANEVGQHGVTTTTAAALIVLDGGTNDCAVRWLRSRWCKQGGFVAAEHVPFPDILSTATAVLALSLNGIALAGYRNELERFVDLHWGECGGFFGSLADPICDCEYTYHALLILGLIQIF